MSERTNTSILHVLGCLVLKYRGLGFFFHIFTVSGFNMPRLFTPLLSSPFHVCASLFSWFFFDISRFLFSILQLVESIGFCCQSPLILMIFFVLSAAFFQLVYFTDHFQTYFSGLHLSHYFSAKYFQSLKSCLFKTKITALTLCLQLWDLLHCIHMCRKHLA